MKYQLFFFLLASLPSFAQEQKAYWPKQLKLEGYTITIYRPEAEHFENNILDARSAFSVFDGEHLPVFGAMWFRARVLTDVKNNKVSFTGIRMMDASIHGADAQTIQQLQKLIAEAAPTWRFNSDLKKFYAALQPLLSKNEYGEQLLHKPPEIYYAQKPTILVFIDGTPVLENIEGSELYQVVINTPHLIVRSSSDNHFYLRGGDWWYTATAVTGPWQAIETPPSFISRLVDNADKLSPEEKKPKEKTGRHPALIVTDEPAILIQTNGMPEMKPLCDNIMEITNSEDAILFDTDASEYYILASGRWYKTASLKNGPWTFVMPENLPPSFKNIPKETPVSHVRMSVPGTPEAIAAALNNSIPQTAIVDRQKATMQVEYDGEPQFEPIRGTSLKYAVNTAGSVIMDKNGSCYAVDQAVWFTAANPMGPWGVADHFPEEVKNIPPDCPVYNIKFVQIYDYSPELVYVGYTPGYLGQFLYHGIMVYGTGYKYKSWHGNKYYAKPFTYGYGAKKKQQKAPNISFYASTGYPGMAYGYPYGGWGYGYGGYWPYYGYGMGSVAAYRQYYYQGQQAAVDFSEFQPQQKPLDPVNIYNNRAVGIVKTETVQRSDPMKVAVPDAHSPKDMYVDDEGHLYRQDQYGKWFKENGSDWEEMQGTPKMD